MGISGSLRTGSAATTILEIVARLSPAGVQFNIYDGLEEIPPFNDSREIPDTVKSFIRQIEDSDGVFICSPEYAYGVPGVLKNALDWTVSTVSFYQKPVALITAASSGEKAHASLLLTLTALSTKISAGTSLLIPAVRSKLNENNELKDLQTFNEIKTTFNTFITKLKSEKRLIPLEHTPHRG
jgi:chromate reductase, NAD(P)H dehydrogenase (quinone)